jgi:Leucine-rich repeat (LRR) protein
MRLLLMLLFIFSFLKTIAQPKVLLMSEMSVKEQSVLEPSYQNSIKSGNYPIAQTLEEALKTALAQPKLRIHVFVKAYVGAKGTIDYLFLDLPEQFTNSSDSAVAKLKEKLKSLLADYKAPIIADCPFLFGAEYGPPRRNAKQNDTSLVDVPQLLAFKDTLAIKQLVLTNLQLGEVPVAIYRFPNLEALLLGGNELNSVTIDFRKLPKLKRLDLQNNKLTNKRIHLTKNNSLIVLNLKENKLTDIPPAVKNCKRLHSLLLAANDLSQLSGRNFKQLRSVVDLNLYKTNLTKVPRQISKMKQLEILDLYHNNLTELPLSIAKLSKLTQLAVAHNQISYLPYNLYKLKHLHTLYAHHNRLTRVPDKIEELSALKILDLGYNWFNNFPAQVTRIQQLEELNLTSNNLTAFPEELLQLAKVKKLYLWGNPFLTNTTEQHYASQLNELKAKNIEVFH